MRDYLKVSYKNMPLTAYPGKLSKYLFDRFGMKQDQRIFDLGCGRGEYVRAFWKLGMDVVGTDICNSIGSKSTPKFRIYESDVEQGLQFVAEYFDYVFAKSVLEHLHDPEKIVSDCCRVLKLGGMFISMVPDWKRCYKSFYGDYGHKTPITSTSLAQMMEAAGLDDIHVEVFYQVPQMWKSPWLKLPMQFLSLFPFKSNDIKFSRQPMLLGWAIKKSTWHPFDLNIYDK